MDDAAFGIGFSKNIIPQEAAQEAAFQVRRHLGSKNVSTAILLTTAHYPPEQSLPVIRQHLRPEKLIGCSTAGIILSQSIEARGLAVIALNAETIRASTSHIDQIDALDPQTTGTEFAQQALKNFGKSSRQLLLFFVDGKFQQTHALLKGMQSVLGNIFSIVGAGSCADAQLKNHFQIHQSTVTTNALTGLIIGGLEGAAVTGQHGWRPLGKPRSVTKSTHNVIHTINDKSAVKLYEEYFGKEDARSLLQSPLEGFAPLYPLGIHMRENNKYLLRNAVDIQPDGGIVCQGEVPEHSTIHIMFGNKDSCQQAALHAAQECKSRLLGKKIKLVLIIESVTRLRLLGRAATEEIKLIHHVFGRNTPLIGMYSQSEIFPFDSGFNTERSNLQNESIIILALT